MSLKKTIKQLYPKMIGVNEKPEQTAEKILIEIQNYYILRLPDLFNFVKDAVTYINPNGEIPESQKTLLNEYFQKCIVSDMLNKGAIKEN